MYLWIVRVINYKHKKEPTFRLIPFICLESVTLTIHKYIICIYG